MKSSVETLSPTRVRLAVEVEFDELKPSLDKAYRSIAEQVAIPGFRRGKVPPRLIDQRFGRATVLEQAIQDAIPTHYSSAVSENKVRVVSQPQVEITELMDGEKIAFTAEVDVRPEITLPDLSSLTPSVGSSEVTDDDIAEELKQLQERFGSLVGVERPIVDGDYAAIDLSVEVDGKKIEGGDATNMSHQVGGPQLLAGLDEALIGLSVGESKTFVTTLTAGEYADKAADVTVTVKSVKVKELPELDDDFAGLAGSFDTLDELKVDLRSKAEDTAARRQLAEASEACLNAVVDVLDIPLPEQALADEIAARKKYLTEQMQQMGLNLETYLQITKTDAQTWEQELTSECERSLRTQFVLDALADEREINVNDYELTGEVIRRAEQSQTSPEEYARHMSEHGHLPLIVSDIRRAKAAAVLVEEVTVTDAAGNKIDLSPPNEVNNDTDFDELDEDAESTEAVKSDESSESDESDQEITTKD